MLKSSALVLAASEIWIIALVDQRSPIIVTVKEIAITEIETEIVPEVAVMIKMIGAKRIGGVIVQRSTSLVV